MNTSETPRNDDALRNLLKLDGVEISPCEENTSDRYKKLDLNESQQSSISLLVSQLPNIVASDTLSHTYQLKFPEGIPHTLMQYKNGGEGTMIVDENHKIIAHASLYETSASYAAMLNMFTIMSVATGQYFLAEINKNFKLINQKIDKILDFLYGEKKAELLAEIGFVKNAYANYPSIMEHSEQRIATIASLQSAQKIAMKDIEFYLSDLNHKTRLPSKSYEDFKETSESAFNIKNCLELSMQLFAMSNIMEVHFSQNTDPEYLRNVRESVTQYISKCDKRILSDFSSLNGKNNNFKSNMIRKIDPEPLNAKFDNVIGTLNNGETSPINKAVINSIDSLTKPMEYMVTDSGNIYMLKTS